MTALNKTVFMFVDTGFPKKAQAFPKILEQTKIYLTMHTCAFFLK